jgi:hypothetical protein
MTTTTKPHRTRKATTPTTVEEGATVLAKTQVGNDAEAEAMRRPMPACPPQTVLGC